MNEEEMTDGGVTGIYHSFNKPDRHLLIIHLLSNKFGILEDMILMPRCLPNVRHHLNRILDREAGINRSESGKQPLACVITHGEVPTKL